MKQEHSKYSTWKNVKFMIKFAYGTKKSIIYKVLIIAFVSILINVANLYIAPSIISNLENEVTLSELLTTIAFFTIFLMVLNALKVYFIKRSFFERATLRLELQKKVNYKRDTTSYPNVINKKMIDKLEKVNTSSNGNDGFGEQIWTVLTEILISFSSFIIYSSLLLVNVNKFLILIVGVISIHGYIMSNKINKWSFNHKEEEATIFKQMEYVHSSSLDSTLAKDVSIFGMKNWLKEMNEKSFSLYTNFAIRREKHLFMVDVIDIVFTFFKNGLAYFYFIMLVINNEISISEFLLYFSAITCFNQMLTKTLENLLLLQRQSIDICDTREYLEYPEPFLFEEGKSLTPKTNASYEIKLVNVSFKYSETDTYILKNINLIIHPNEKLAVVGMNGAGKTTLIKIICGFLDPIDGEVLLNGQNIKQYNRRDYYKHFSTVFQDFALIETSILENIIQSTVEVDEDLLQDCLQKANILEKINSLPNGVHTHFGNLIYEDGISLSGGETQRLMLARALYKQAPIIVLDEPTAALDPISESEMYKNYHTMTMNKTSIYISHRLASTRFCDRIILIEENVISEQGTHQELMEQQGSYATLYNIQSKYYQEGSDF